MTFEEWYAGKSGWDTPAVEVWNAAIEECAKVCDDLHRKWHWGEDSPDSGPNDCAKAIRLLERLNSGVAMKTKYIDTWQERCIKNKAHDGIVTSVMIQARMQEEIDDLRCVYDCAGPVE